MKRGKNLVIDFWRLIFSLIIMLYHTVYFKEYYGYFPIFRNGYIGVEFFCIVSGFLMVKSSYKIDLHSALTGKETIRFLLRKIRSILSYWFFVSLLCLGIRLLEVKNIYMAIEQIAFSIWNFLFLQKSGLAPFALINVGWYVSSMLMCMLILYPLCIRNRDIFINILCPAVSICIYSFFSLRYKHIAIGTDWYGCINSGTLRVCGGLCLGGGGVYALSQYLAELTLSHMQRVLLTSIEWICMTGIIFLIWFAQNSYWDFIIILLLAISLTIIFSQKSYTSNFITCKYGELSVAIYLSQAPVLAFFTKYNLEISFMSMLGIYLFLTIGLSVLLLCLVKVYRRIKTSMTEDWPTK